VFISQPGGYYVSTGVIESVELLYGVYGSRGVFIGEEIAPYTVTITEPGVYYREDDEAEPYVADVTVTITQNPPSEGAGAQLSATVDSDPASATFGQITGVTIDDGGDNYLAWRWVDTCCGDILNGKHAVLQRANCTYTKAFCDRGGSGFVTVDYRGTTLPPLAQLNLSSDASSTNPCALSLTASENITNCDELGFVVSDEFGRTLTVTTGGDYSDATNGLGETAGDCTPCCRGFEYGPDELTVAVAGIGDRSGTYVVPKQTIGGGIYWQGLFGDEFPDGSYDYVYVYAQIRYQPVPYASCDTCDACRIVFQVGRDKTAVVDGRLVSVIREDWIGASECTSPPYCTPTGTFTVRDATITFG